jgi:Fur family ferric uptake transcriptional regulator
MAVSKNKRYETNHHKTGHDFQHDFSRMTIPRKLILELLSETSHHLSAEEIYRELLDKYPKIGLATVYRNLEYLVQKGFICRFDFGDRRSRYELVKKEKSENYHHHLVCTKCGKIIHYTDSMGVDMEFMKSLEEKLAKFYNFKITNYMVQFNGICADCQVNH